MNIQNAKLGTKNFFYYDKTGFTLVELMIIVSILGILVAIILPKYAGMIQKAKEGRTKGNLGALRAAIGIYYADNEGHWPYESTLDLIAGGAGQMYPDSWIDSEWPVLTPQYIDEIPAVYTGQANAWGSSTDGFARPHEGRGWICRCWAKGGSTGVASDAMAGTAHHESSYEYIYYVCSSPTDGTGNLNGHVWINCGLLDSKGQKVMTW